MIHLHSVVEAQELIASESLVLLTHLKRDDIKMTSHSARWWGGVKPINIDCFDKLQFSDYVTILHAQSFSCIYDARFTQMAQDMRSEQTTTQ